MSKHTPGPWKVDAGETYNVRDGATEGVVCQIHFLRGRMGLAGRIPAEQGLANARLIAAAPELLAALKLAGDLFAANHAISQFDWGKSALRAEDIRELNDVPLAIRAAIARAEGGQS